MNRFLKLKPLKPNVMSSRKPIDYNKFFDRALLAGIILVAIALGFAINALTSNDDSLNEFVIFVMAGLIMCVVLFLGVATVYGLQNTNCSSDES